MFYFLDRLNLLSKNLNGLWCRCSHCIFYYYYYYYYYWIQSPCEYHQQQQRVRWRRGQSIFARRINQFSKAVKKLMNGYMHGRWKEVGDVAVLEKLAEPCSGMRNRILDSIFRFFWKLELDKGASRVVDQLCRARFPNILHLDLDRIASQVNCIWIRIWGFFSTPGSALPSTSSLRTHTRTKESKGKVKQYLFRLFRLRSGRKWSLDRFL